ncbi:MAG: hypothetical protein U0X91_00605 [Spirosomataceae bacterium]
MNNKRRNFSAEFKAKVALEAIKEELTLSELAANRVGSQARFPIGKYFLASASSVFAPESVKKRIKREDIAKLYEQIGRLQVEKYFSKKNL